MNNLRHPLGACLVRAYKNKNLYFIYLNQGDDDFYSSFRPKFVLDDFTDSLYASKSTVAYGDNMQENCLGLLKSMEYVDPRGRVNISE